MYVNINDGNFEEEVIGSKIPVLVDFWAPWCGPCQRIGPMIEEIGREYEGKVKVCKVNVDEGREIAVRYGVSSIPTLAVFQDGEVKSQEVGAFPKGEIVQMFSSLIS